MPPAPQNKPLIHFAAALGSLLTGGILMTRLSGLALLASLALLFPLSLRRSLPARIAMPLFLEAGLVPGCAGFVAEAAGGS